MKSEFLLPYPPSANSLYANRKGGRRKTDSYERWLNAAGWMMRAAPDRHHRHAGPVRLTILIKKPDKRKRDVSNLVKAIEDLLVRHQIMGDDSQVQAVNVQWSDEAQTGAKVSVEDLV